MTRQFFADRGLDELLGSATTGSYEDVPFGCNAMTATALSDDKSEGAERNYRHETVRSQRMQS